MRAATAEAPQTMAPREPDVLESVRQRAKTWRAPPALAAAIERQLREATETARDRKVRPSRDLLPEQRLIQRLSLGWTVAEQALIDQLGYDAYLERQLDFEAIDDSFLEDALAQALPTLSMTPAQIYDNYIAEPFVPVVELVLATMFRSIYSPRLLFERMAIFWTDHFNIDLFSGAGFLLKPTDDREVIRGQPLGTFPELLWASAHSPAMLAYLTNDTNVKEHPNENYARELMELHTMGPEGFTEQDVKEVARCFTGWRFHGPGAGPLLGRFFFDANAHDTGEKIVLGQVIPAGGGIEDGEMVLTLLTGRPETAAFIARKLLNYTWGYEPPAEAVAEVASAYEATGGNIRAMLRAALTRDRIADATPKLKRPYHLMVSALRALFADVSNPGSLFEYLLEAGHVPFAWAPPNGYPDSLGYWSGLILPRWNFAAEVPFEGTAAFEDALTSNGRRLAIVKVVSQIDRLLFNGTMPAATQQGLRRFLLRGPLDEQRVQDAYGLAMGSPEFQNY